VGLATDGRCPRAAAPTPRLWARTTGGELQVWRARRIALATRGLSRAAAAWVDAQAASFAHQVGPAQTERLVDAAVARHDPALAQEQREAANDRRCFEVDHRQVSFAGTSRVYGELDLADALDHLVAWPNGPTADDNLAPLCRFHHRVKTHGGWTHTRIDDSALLWRSPHGLALLCDPTGTRDVSNRWVADPPDD
jgi:hypothetical protein